MIGKLDRRITIEVASEVQDSDNGEVTLTWSEYATRWSNVALGSTGSNENFEEFQKVATQTADFTIRYDSVINAKSHRINYNGSIFDIKRVHEVTDKRRTGYTLIFAEKRDNE